jgi:hypothetical protein
VRSNHMLADRLAVRQPFERGSQHSEGFVFSPVVRRGRRRFELEQSPICNKDVPPSGKSPTAVVCKDHRAASTNLLTNKFFRLVPWLRSWMMLYARIVRCFRRRPLSPSYGTTTLRVGQCKTATRIAQREGSWNRWTAIRADQEYVDGHIQTAARGGV